MGTAHILYLYESEKATTVDTPSVTRLKQVRSWFWPAALSIFLLAPVQAQDVDEDSTRYHRYYRADGSFYLKGRLGLNLYGGDRDINPDNEVQKYIESIGYSLGVELGYHFSDRFSLGLMHLSGRYPRIEDITRAPGVSLETPAYGILDQATTSKWRHHFTLVGRSYVLPYERFTPYGQYGFHVSIGKINDEMRLGLGPMAGLGLDIAVDDHIGIFVELLGIFVFDDEALDLADTRARNTTTEGGGIDASDFDAFTFLGLGIRYTFKRAFTPLNVSSVYCPGQLNVGERGVFAALTNEAVIARPVENRWSFGDGVTATGQSARHSYAQARIYTVTFTAASAHDTDTGQCSVRVIAPPEIVDITADRKSVAMCEQAPPIHFSADVKGDTPLTYSWDFGDGATSTAVTPSNRYTTEGIYTVMLTLSNPAGSDTSSLTITASPCAPLACEQVALRLVFFERDASTFSAQGLQAMEENVNILQECPVLNVRVEGFASESESNPQQLLQDRARAIKCFYLKNNIEESRIKTTSPLQPCDLDQ